MQTSQTQIQDYARQLVEARGDRAAAEAAQTAAAFAQAGDTAQAETWRRIAAAVQRMRGAHQS